MFMLKSPLLLSLEKSRRNTIIYVTHIAHIALSKYLRLWPM